MSEREPQSFATHRRLITGYHFVLGGIVFANLIIQVIGLFKRPSWSNGWDIVMAAGFILMFWYLRVFPNRVQDRVIRLEERMRLGRLLPPELRPRLGEFAPNQLVALRFASDEELPTLAARVLNENITSKTAIKALIAQWRADHLRA
jgi:uncharacterized protein DUF6526